MLLLGAPETPLQYGKGILIVLAAGSSGGLVAAIGALVEGGKTANGRHYVVTRGVSTRFFLFGRTIVGIGGAVAILLAALSVNKFTGSSDIDLLSLTALCFVAGSIGHRLLPMVAAQVERRLGEAEKKAEQAVQRVEEAEGSAGLTRDLQVAIELLNSRERMGSKEQQLIASLEGWSRLMPHERTLHIVLGRLYDEKQGDTDKAIETLRRFIASKGTVRDNDVADALWNIACYFTKKMVEATNDQTREQMAKQAIDTLRESIRITPGNREGLDTDDDLKPLVSSRYYSEGGNSI